MLWVLLLFALVLLMSVFDSLIGVVVNTTGNEKVKLETLAELAALIAFVLLVWSVLLLMLLFVLMLWVLLLFALVLLILFGMLLISVFDSLIGVVVNTTGNEK